MKKLPNFKPSLITKEFFSDYGGDVALINEGDCFKWAYFSYLLFEGVELWEVDCHAFIRYRGRFYDSEVLRGSPDWQDLPATEGTDHPARPLSLSQFKANWYDQSKRMCTSWNKIEAEARKVLRRAQASI